MQDFKKLTQLEMYMINVARLYLCAGVYIQFVVLYIYIYIYIYDDDAPLSHCWQSGEPQMLHAGP